MGERIRALITQAEFWRDQHARAGHSIDAAACAIRIRALQDALKIVEARSHGA